MDVAEVLAARRFILLDEQGNARAELTAQTDGIVGLLVYGKGDSSATVAVGMEDESGAPTVVVRRPAPDGQDYGTVVLGVTEEGEAAVQIKDAGGTRRNLFADE
jgi:hypothetical protein